MIRKLSVLFKKDLENQNYIENTIDILDESEDIILATLDERYNKNKKIKLFENTTDDEDYDDESDAYDSDDVDEDELADDDDDLDEDDDM